MLFPLVARAGVLAEADAVLAAARAGRGALVTVTGEPGIGKTRLAEAVADRARAGPGEAFEVIWTWCPAAAGGAPLRPWSRVGRAGRPGPGADPGLRPGRPGPPPRLGRRAGPHRGHGPDQGRDPPGRRGASGAGTAPGPFGPHRHVLRLRPRPAGPLGRLFTPDAFLDLTMPAWRIQTAGAEDLIAVRKEGHPGPGRVIRWRADPAPAGFVFEFEERWDHDGQEWYAREMMRAEVAGGQIAELTVYCTGDWDQARQAEHAAAVTLLRP